MLGSTRVTVLVEINNYCLYCIFQCCHIVKPCETVKLGVGDDDIMKRLLEIPGPYATARRVYTSYSSLSRPTASMVKNCMTQLQEQGLGTYKIVNKHNVYYKKLPADELKPKLAVYGISLESYSAVFRSEDENYLL